MSERKYAFPQPNATLISTSKINMQLTQLGQERSVYSVSVTYSVEPHIEKTMTITTQQSELPASLIRIAEPVSEAFLAIFRPVVS